MSIEQIDQLLSLPLAERVELAQALWQSIDEAPDIDARQDEQAAVSEANRRDAELTAGTVGVRSHEQVMEAARRAIECA